MRLSKFALSVLLLWPLTASMGVFAAPEKVRLQLRWTHQFQFAGYYMAVEQGYYRERGLEVVLLEQNDQFDSVETVVSGKAEFGVGNSEMVMHFHNGAPIVSLAVIFQHSPLALAVAEEHSKLSDLAHQPVMIEPSSAELIALFAKSGIQLSQLNILQHSYDSDDLMSGRIKAMSIYQTDEPFIFQENKFNYSVIKPIDHGIDVYGDTLFTTQSYQQQHPEQVAAFREASLQGWKYALKHIDETIDLIHQKYDTQHSKEHLHFEAQALLPFIQAKNVPLGVQSLNRWKNISAVYQQTDLLHHQQNLMKFIYSPVKAQSTQPWLGVAPLACLILLLAIIIYAVKKRQALTNRQFENDYQFEHLAMASIKLNTKMQVTAWNQKAEDIFGWRAEEIIGSNVYHFLVPDHFKDQVENVAATVWDEQKNSYSINENITRSGQIIMCHWHNTPLKDKHGHIIGAACLVSDISEQIQSQQNLERFRATIEAIVDAVIIIDKQGLISYSNPAVTQQFGYRPKRIQGKQFSHIIAEESEPEALWQKVSQQHSWEGEVMIRHHQGKIVISHMNISPAQNHDEQLLGYVAIIKDISDQKAYSQKLKKMAHYDLLTGLPNRSLFFDRLQQSIEQAKRRKEVMAVVFIDLDGFKGINDSLGHAAGDELLKHVARRFVRSIRHSDTLARIGGDEFVAILNNIRNAEFAYEVTEKVRAELTAPFIIEHQEVKMAASVGVALFPDDGESAEQLLQKADSAMYQVKKSDGNDSNLY